MNLLQVRFAAQWQNNAQDAAPEPAAGGHAVGEQNRIIYHRLRPAFCLHVGSQRRHGQRRFVSLWNLRLELDAEHLRFVASLGRCVLVG